MLVVVFVLAMLVVFVVFVVRVVRVVVIGIWVWLLVSFIFFNYQQSGTNQTNKYFYGVV